MNAFSILFYILSSALIISSLCVVLVTSPIFSALFLAITMTLLSAVFFMLGAYFLAAIQLTVYAGAVVVLFVIVLMLFDLRKEKSPFSGDWKSITGKALLSLLAFVLLATPAGFFLQKIAPNWAAMPATETKELSISLFEKQLFTFEIVGVLLLAVLIGSVTLAKSKGGTHAKHHE